MSKTPRISEKAEAFRESIRTTSRESEAQNIIDLAHDRKRQQTIMQVREILAEHLGHEPGTIQPADHVIDDLGADSLDLVELAMVYEDTFGIRIADEDIRNLRTVESTVTWIVSRISPHGRQ